MLIFDAFWVILKSFFLVDECAVWYFRKSAFRTDHTEAPVDEPWGTSLGASDF